MAMIVITTSNSTKVNASATVCLSQVLMSLIIDRELSTRGLRRKNGNETMRGGKAPRARPTLDERETLGFAGFAGEAPRV
jgi:hypothetical protein